MIKLALIYDVKDRKLQSDSYSQVYRSQFLALQHRFENVQHVVESCSADDIDADVIIFYDVHSSHHFKIDGIKHHGAIKYEYLNDPHQEDVKGRYNFDNSYIHKLGPKQRVKRLLLREVQYIICPSVNGYYEYLAPYLNGQADDMLLWFPASPTIRYFKNRTRPLAARIEKVLANGALAEGGTCGYKFRRWAFQQKCVYFSPHYAENHKAPIGRDYPDFLAKFAGALALNSIYIVPKYLEIPLAGCVCFAQKHPDYERMGFKNGKNCIFVDKENFTDVIEGFKKDVSSFQKIADAGRELIEEKWTAECFADCIYNHAKKRL